MGERIRAHSTPRWFAQRRYGLFVHANLASVPAFAPLHEYADWYWSFLEPRADVALHPTTPLPEVVAWHAEHWPGYAFDDFVRHLTFERFDPDAYADLAVEAGMGYVVHVTKHHDGFCWWDSALTDRSSARQGPHRDVVAELADATRRAGLEFGCYHSLLDWAHPDYPDAERYVDGYLRPQIRELVERFRPAVLWGDGQWGHPGSHWRSEEILAEYYAAADRLGFEAAVNDRFWASHVDFRTYEYEVPDEPPDGPWELCRGLAHSFCFNQVEEPDDHLDPRGVVALLAETVAKGGNLLLNVGPRADGTVPEIQEQILRDAGTWVRAHDDAIHGSVPFAEPGAGDHWYTVTPGGEPTAGQRVNAVDLSAAPAPCFAALGTAAGTVTAVRGPDGEPVGFRQTESGLVPTAAAPPVGALATVYRVDLQPAAQRPVPIRRAGSPGPVTVGGRRHPSVGAALDAAGPGDVVELGAGRYGPDTETFPLEVGEGVTLRAAPGTGRDDVVLDGGGATVVRLTGDAAALEGVTARGGIPGVMMVPPTCVVSAGADRLTVRGCRLQAVALTGGEGHVVEGNDVVGGNVWLLSADRAVVRDNTQQGLRWGTGVELTGGAGHVVERNVLRDDLCPIRAGGTTGARIEGNRFSARWFGIHLLRARETIVRGNVGTRTMRGVGVEGGEDNVVEENVARRCDSGVVVERGATRTRVVGNRLERCRIGVLGWDDVDTRLAGNVVVAPHDHAVVCTSPLDVDRDDLGGGDVLCVPRA